MASIKREAPQVLSVFQRLDKGPERSSRRRRGCARDYHPGSQMGQPSPVGRLTPRE